MEVDVVYFEVKGWGSRWRLRGCSLGLGGCSLRLRGCSGG